MARNQDSNTSGHCVTGKFVTAKYGSTKNVAKANYARDLKAFIRERSAAAKKMEARNRKEARASYFLRAISPI